MPRDAPGRARGLVEIEERLEGLHQISDSITSRFEAQLDLSYVDPADFDLGPTATLGGPPEHGAENASTLHANGPVTAEVALKSARGLAKTKDTARARQCAGILHRALVLGNTDARAVACGEEAVKAIVDLVGEHLPLFEYAEIRNASKIMYKRDVDRAKVRAPIHNGVSSSYLYACLE